MVSCLHSMFLGRDSSKGERTREDLSGVLFPASPNERNRRGAQRGAVCTPSGLRATNLPLLPRRLELPVALCVDLLLPPHRRTFCLDTTDRAIRGRTPNVPKYRRKRVNRHNLPTQQYTGTYTVTPECSGTVKVKDI
jgi:hypothetical protein